MKVNVEIDMSPEELRRFMGLPDVQGFQQQMLEAFTENLQSSKEQQEAFAKSIFTNTFAPWESFISQFGAKPKT